MPVSKHPKCNYSMKKKESITGDEVENVNIIRHVWQRKHFHENKITRSICVMCAVFTLTVRDRVRQRKKWPMEKCFCVFSSILRRTKTRSRDVAKPNWYEFSVGILTSYKIHCYITVILMTRANQIYFNNRIWLCECTSGREYAAYRINQSKRTSRTSWGSKWTARMAENEKREMERDGNKWTEKRRQKLVTANWKTKNCQRQRRRSLYVAVPVYCYI